MRVISVDVRRAVGKPSEESDVKIERRDEVVRRGIRLGDGLLEERFGANKVALELEGEPLPEAGAGRHFGIGERETVEEEISLVVAFTMEGVDTEGKKGGGGGGLMAEERESLAVEKEGRGGAVFAVFLRCLGEQRGYGTLGAQGSQGRERRDGGEEAEGDGETVGSVSVGDGAEDGLETRFKGPCASHADGEVGRLAGGGNR